MHEKHDPIREMEKVVKKTHLHAKRLNQFSILFLVNIELKEERLFDLVFVDCFCSGGGGEPGLVFIYTGKFINTGRKSKLSIVSIYLGCSTY